MSSTETTVAAVQSGPPPIHKLKFETPPPYNGLRWMSWILEGVGSLLIIADVNMIGFWRPEGGFTADIVSLMVIMLVTGALLVAVAEITRILIRMQHDTLRMREYLHYVTWAELTSQNKNSPQS